MSINYKYVLFIPLFECWGYEADNTQSLFDILTFCSSDFFLKTNQSFQKLGFADFFSQKLIWLKFYLLKIFIFLGFIFLDTLFVWSSNFVVFQMDDKGECLIYLNLFHYITLRFSVFKNNKLITFFALCISNYHNRERSVFNFGSITSLCIFDDFSLFSFNKNRDLEN